MTCGKLLWIVLTLIPNTRHSYCSSISLTSNQEYITAASTHVLCIWENISILTSVPSAKNWGILTMSSKHLDTNSLLVCLYLNSRPYLWIMPIESCACIVETMIILWNKQQITVIQFTTTLFSKKMCRSFMKMDKGKCYNINISLTNETSH